MTKAPKNSIDFASKNHEKLTPEPSKTSLQYRCAIGTRFSLIFKGFSSFSGSPQGTNFRKKSLAEGILGHTFDPPTLFLASFGVLEPNLSDLRTPGHLLVAIFHEIPSICEDLGK